MPEHAGLAKKREFFFDMCCTLTLEPPRATGASRKKQKEEGRSNTLNTLEPTTTSQASGRT